MYAAAACLPAPQPAPYAGGNYLVTDEEQVRLIRENERLRGQQGWQQTGLIMASSAIGLPGRDAITAMGEAVDRSNQPNGDDRRGGFHEEGGQFGIDSTGREIAVAAAPGRAANPGEDHVSIRTGVFANPADKDRIRTLLGTFHVHPRGDTPQGPSASSRTTFTIGERRTTTFRQEPSSQDFTSAAGRPGLTHFVLGSGANRVYIYDAIRVRGTMPLDRFRQIGR